MPRSPPQSWAERNDAVIALGLAWLRAELEGFISTSSAAPRIGAEAARAAREAYQAARVAMCEDGELAQIDRLSKTFALAPFDEDCLLMALAPHVDGTFSALFGYAHDRLQIQTPTVHLAGLLLGIEGNSQRLALGRFSPDAPLRRFALLSLDDTNPTALARFGIDERIARWLIGEDYVDPRVRAWLRPIPVMLCPHRHRHAAASLANQLRSTESRCAVIFGPAQSGRRAVAQRVARELGLHLVELSRAFSSRDPEVQRAQTALLAREAALGNFALIIDVSPVTGIESEHHDRSNREVARLLMETFDGVCLVTSEDRLDFAPSLPRLPLNALESDDRLALWRESFGPGANPEQMELVAEHFRFGPAEIAAVASQTPATHDLWSACRTLAGRSLENLADRIEPRFGWDDIVLPPAVIHDLRAIAAQVRHQSQVYNRGGFRKKLVRGRGVIALFSGASGVGKTMAAEVIARDLGLDLCRIDLSGVVSKYIGETERHLNAIFQKMELGGAVLMFDECDALFGKRGEINDGRDRYANLEVSYLLQRIETYSGLAILATNLKGNIDPAFLRRLRYVINIPFPDTSLRLAIWRRAFPAETQTEGVDFEALARLDIAGGNIAVIAVNSAFLAAADGSPVRMSHIARAAESEFRKIDKEFPSTWPVRR